MELTSEEPGVIIDFDDFNQIPLGRGPADDQSFLFKNLFVVVVEFKPMTMAF